MYSVLIFSSIIVIVLLLFGFWGIITHNNLIAKRNRVKQCKSGICVVLKQRNDLIPNLVSSVKAYMGHENETLTKIAELRSRVTSGSEQELIKDGSQMSALLGKLKVSVESYPDLKANEQFQNLQEQIQDMEDELQAIRRTYNAAVTDYNNYIEMFPSLIIASWKRFEQEELIDIPNIENEQINVSSLFNDGK